MEHVMFPQLLSTPRLLGRGPQLFLSSANTRIRVIAGCASTACHRAWLQPKALVIAPNLRHTTPVIRVSVSAAACGKGDDRGSTKIVHIHLT